MKKYEFNLKKEHALRLKSYLESPINKFSYLESRKNDYTDGWRYISVTENSFKVTYDSGQQLDSSYLCNFNIDHTLEGLSSKKEHEKLKLFLKRKIKSYLSKIFPQFDARIKTQIRHYENLWDNNNGIDISEIKKKHKLIHFERLLAYNYFNELNPYLNKFLDQEISTLYIAEIGPGVGNLTMVFLEHFRKLPIKYILVDLPEALPFSISHLMYWIPDMSFVLPNELESPIIHYKNNINCQVIFMTPQQFCEIPEHTIDVAVNTNSFSEMPSNEITKYFDILRKALKKENIFFTVNRVEKATDLKTQNSIGTKVASEKIYIEKDDSFEIKRFQDFPWSENDHIYAFFVESFNMSKTAKNFFLKIVKLETCS